MIHQEHAAICCPNERPPTAPVEFIVHAIPVAQPRQRTRVVATANGQTFAQNYTPTRDPVNSFKASVRLAASEAHKGAPLTGPLCMTLVCVFPRSKSLLWKKRPMPRLPKQGKPDADNVAKAVSDCLNGLLYVDDSQIVRLVVEKWIASGDEQAHCAVRVECL